MVRTKRGFTLIELLVVIAIIGILSSVVLASLNSARQKSRDARRIADVKQLQVALELYYDANNSYPTALSALVTGGQIPVVPTDPQSGSYHYAALGSGASCSSYHLGAVLENSGHTALSNDKDGAAGTVCTGGGTDFHGSTADCVATTAGTDSCYDVKP